MERILLIDDDVELGTMLREYMRRHGFALDIASSGDKGLAQLRRDTYNLVLLDVMLPGLDGFEVLRELRRMSQIDAIMLTARGEEVDRIVGLEIGADDYVPKPFNPRELLARIRAVQRRRAKQSPQRSALQAGRIRLNVAERSVFCARQAIELTTIEFDLLKVLLESAGQVVTRDALVKAVLGRGFDPFDRSLDMHVSRLRRKLESGGEGDCIKTVRSIGYQLSLPSQSDAAMAEPRRH